MLLQIPKKVLVHEDHFQATELGKRIMSHKNDFHSYNGKLEETMVGLGLADIIAKGPSHIMAPYITSLPEDLSHLPKFWSSAKLALHTEQHGSYIESAVKKYKVETRAEYDKLLRIDGAFGRLCSFPLFLKLMAQKQARGFDGAGMVPLGDMMNHALAANVGYNWDETTEVFIMKTATDISKGDQLEDSYKIGTGWENHFLLHYGFVPQMEQYRTSDPMGAHTIKAEELRRKGKWGPAIELLQSAIDFAKKDQWKDKEQTAVMHLFLGAMLIDAGVHRRGREPTTGQVTSDYDTAEQTLNEVRVVTILTARETKETTY
jgi:hypothetical protein